MREYPGVYVEEVPGTFRSISSAPPSVSLVDTGDVPLGSVIGTVVHGRWNPIWQSDWKYVNIRREVIFIEQSLGEGLQWVVFENNGPGLWSRVKQSIDSFLTSQWLSGSLHGKRKDEAFFVKCDRTTMTQNDLDNGRLVAIVGIAPVRPAEFMIIRISCLTDQSKP